MALLSSIRCPPVLPWSGRDASPVGVVHGPDGGAGRVARPGDLDLEANPVDRVGREAGVILECRETDSPAEGVRIRARPHVAHPSAVPEERFAAVQERFGILEEHLDQAARRGPGHPPREQRIPPDEAAGLVPGDREAEPHVGWRVRVVDVEAVVAVRLLQPQAAQGAHPDVPVADVCSSLHERVVNRERHLGRDVQLPAQLTHVRDPHRQDAGVVEVDLPRGQERERLVGQVGAREAGQELPRERALDGHEGRPGRDVRDRDVGILRRVALDPRRDPPVDEVGHDDEEPVLRQARDGQVGLDPAGRVQPRGVHEAPDRDGHVVGRDQVEDPLRVAALDEELGHQGHVQHAHGLSDGAVLGSLERERRVAAPTRDDLRGLAGACEPLGVFPPGRRPEVGPGCRQSIVDGRAADVPPGPVVPVREGAVGEQPAQLLDGSIRAEAPARLERLGAIDGHAHDVHRRDAIRDPLGGHASDTAAEQDAERVHAGRHEVAPQLRRLAEQGRVVRGEALRPAEHGPDAHVVEGWEAIERP